MARLPKLPTDPLVDPLKAALVKTAGVLLKSDKDVDELLGELLLDVQKQRIYGDGKTFVDLVPAHRLRSIKEEYALLKDDPRFDLREFVSRHFYETAQAAQSHAYTRNPAHTPLEHIDELWTVLTRRNRVTRGSLIALPHSYIVPGGRFNEQFYWDSYFIMLGLNAAQRWTDIDYMMKNFAHQIRKYGYIPTANRAYLLSRSQPPFFSHMVRLVAVRRGSWALRTYLPYLVAEYRFWMKGRTKLADTTHNAYRRVVRLPHGELMNRYYDNKATPRPESLREDIEAAYQSGRDGDDRMYLHLRAAAESGWDFSSRWFLNPDDIRTIHTADIIPVDLNSLLYHLEMTIADAYRASFNLVQARAFRKKAQARRQALDTYCWDERGGFYRDYNFHHSTQTQVVSLAGVFPLFVGAASQAQADKVAALLRQEFLQSGGLVTTKVETGQQWDAPNGWAPLQWVAMRVCADTATTSSPAKFDSAGWL